MTAEQVREELERPLKDLTVRTVLRRLEEKGYLGHTIDNRTFYYQPAESRQRVAGRAVKRIVDWFCEGSVEELLVGMVDSKVLDRAELQRLADRIAAAAQKNRLPEKRRVGNDAIVPGFGDLGFISCFDSRRAPGGYSRAGGRRGAGVACGMRGGRGFAHSGGALRAGAEDRVGTCARGGFADAADRSLGRKRHLAAFGRNLGGAGAHVVAVSSIAGGGASAVEDDPGHSRDAGRGFRPTGSERGVAPLRNGWT